MLENINMTQYGHILEVVAAYLYLQKMELSLVGVRIGGGINNMSESKVLNLNLGGKKVKLRMSNLINTMCYHLYQGVLLQKDPRVSP